MNNKLINTTKNNNIEEYDCSNVIGCITNKNKTHHVRFDGVNYYISVKGMNIAIDYKA